MKERQSREQKEEKERLNQELDRSNLEIMRLEKTIKECQGELADAASSMASLQDQVSQEKKLFQKLMRRRNLPF